jgi:hypothetical protein
MIVEERNYQFASADLARFLDYYEREGVTIHVRNLGQLIGYFTTEFGDLSEVVHLWGFKDLSDREARRKALWADPQWLAFAAKAPVPVRMRNRLLIPTRFSPLGGVAQ